MMAVYEKLGTEVPKGALFTCAVLYDATALAAPTVVELCVAPFDAKVVRVDMITNVAVDADTAVALKIEGGSAIDTLQTGTTKGTIDSYTPLAAAMEDIDQGEVLTAVSGGQSSSGDALLLVTLQKRES